LRSIWIISQSNRQVNGSEHRPKFQMVPARPDGSQLVIKDKGNTTVTMTGALTDALA
jgi:hypothetical protein